MTKSGDMKAIDVMTRILCDSILRGCSVCYAFESCFFFNAEESSP
jgi:hypothetical protein